MKDMNNKQALVISVMGRSFCPSLPFSQWNPYYKLKNKKEKIEELEMYAFVILGIIGIKEAEIEEVYNFLEKDFKNKENLKKEFKKLKKSSTVQ